MIGTIKSLIIYCMFYIWYFCVSIVWFLSMIFIAIVGIWLYKCTHLIRRIWINWYVHDLSSSLSSAKIYVSACLNWIVTLLQISCSLHLENDVNSQISVCTFFCSLSLSLTHTHRHTHARTHTHAHLYLI